MWYVSEEFKHVYRHSFKVTYTVTIYSSARFRRAATSERSPKSEYRNVVECPTCSRRSSRWDEMTRSCVLHDAVRDHVGSVLFDGVSSPSVVENARNKTWSACVVYIDDCSSGVTQTDPAAYKIGTNCIETFIQLFATAIVFTKILRPKGRTKTLMLFLYETASTAGSCSASVTCVTSDKPARRFARSWFATTDCILVVSWYILVLGQNCYGVVCLGQLGGGRARARRAVPPAPC